MSGSGQGKAKAVEMEAEQWHQTLYWPETLSFHVSTTGKDRRNSTAGYYVEKVKGCPDWMPSIIIQIIGAGRPQKDSIGRGGKRLDSHIF
jgi:hypothetical protein